jgi:hypothetical protein
MRYWFRELGGWALVGVGLYLIYLAYQLATEKKIVEVWPIALCGIFVFRGGIHLLKVAIAARVCQQAQDRLYPVSGTERTTRERARAV